MFKQTIELQDDGESDCTAFLGMQLGWSADKPAVRISAPVITDRLLEQEGMADFQPAPTSGSPKRTGGGRRPAVYEIQKLPVARTDGLFWISRIGHPEIAYLANAPARVAHNLGPTHWHVSTQRALETGRSCCRKALPSDRFVYVQAPRRGLGLRLRG